MNEALRAFVQDLRDRAPEECGHCSTLRKCCNAVAAAHSPLDPEKIHLLGAFGEGFIAQRIRQHFAREERRGNLSHGSGNVLGVRVRSELSTVLRA